MISIATQLPILSGPDANGIHQPLYGRGGHITSFLASIQLGDIVNCLALLLNHVYIPEMVALGSGGQLGMHAQRLQSLPFIWPDDEEVVYSLLIPPPSSNSWFCFSNSLNYMLYFYKVIYFYARLFVPFIDIKPTYSQLFCLVIYVFVPLSLPLRGCFYSSVIMVSFTEPSGS